MSDARHRILRQHVQTDALLGVDVVPIGDAAAAPSTEDRGDHPAPAPPSPQSQSPSRSAAPTQPPAAVPPARGKLFATAPVYPDKLDRAMKLKILTDMDNNEVKGCTKCALSQSRINTVFGEGDPDAKLMFIGEGPGQNEDEQGRPFVGRAGELLNKQIAAMGLTREQVFIANIVKCRPPNNRAPTGVEVDACSDYLRRQIRTIGPKAIVTLGGPAVKHILKTNTGITALRGIWARYEEDGLSIPVMPTFHPAYLLRSYTVENRKKVWSDLQQVMKLLAEG